MIRRNPYFIFKGISSDDMGITVTKLTDIVKPPKRVKQITVPGRQGVLHQDEGTYSNYTYDIECKIVNSRRKVSYGEIVNWLDGSGELIVSAEPDKVYRATIINQFSISGVTKGFSNFLAQFDVHPFKYSASPFNDFLTLTSPSTIYNHGTYYSEPIITVYGTGNITLTINDNQFGLLNINGYITLNSEIMEVYKDKVNCNNQFSSMDFPHFEVGENVISFAGNVQKIEIEPNWRWL